MSNKNDAIGVSYPDVVFTRDAWDKLMTYPRVARVRSKANYGGYGYYGQRNLLGGPGRGRVVSPSNQGKKGNNDGNSRSEPRVGVEVSGYMVVEQPSPDRFKVTDVILMPSEGSAAGTEMTNEGVAEVIAQLSEEGRDEDITNMKGWWHTHPGGVFWSSPDLTQIEKFGKFFDPYGFFIVVNDKGQYRARLDFYNPVRCYFDNITVKVEKDSEEIALEEVVREAQQALEDYKEQRISGWEEFCQSEVDEKVEHRWSGGGRGEALGDGMTWETEEIIPVNSSRGRGSRPYQAPLHDPSVETRHGTPLEYEGSRFLKTARGLLEIPEGGEGDARILISAQELEMLEEHFNLEDEEDLGILVRSCRMG